MTSTKGKLVSEQKSKVKTFQQKIKQLIPIVFFPLIITSIVIQTQIGRNWQHFVKYFYNFTVITNFSDKLSIIKQFIYIMAIYEFVLALLIMQIRIIWYKSRPVKQQDPIIINFLNRIISNTIQQTFIFLGLYCYILFSDILTHRNDILITLPVFFMIGRLIYLPSYSLGAWTGLSPIRALGFGFTIVANSMMVQLIFFKTYYISSLIFG